MDSYVIEATLTGDGSVVLEDLPFQPGESVKITVVRRAPDTEPFVDSNKPKDWKNANPAYWIKLATERIVESFQPEKIVLFGSHARGSASVHSDIDLLVVFKAVENKHDMAVAIRRCLADFPISKDIVIATIKEIDDYGHLVGTVLRPALMEGKTLYERA